MSAAVAEIEREASAASWRGDAVASSAARVGESCSMCGSPLVRRQTIACPGLDGPHAVRLAGPVCLRCETRVTRRWAPTLRPIVEMRVRPGRCELRLASAGIADGPRRSQVVLVTLDALEDGRADDIVRAVADTLAWLGRLFALCRRGAT